jgi:hypothetical protein
MPDSRDASFLTNLLPKGRRSAAIKASGEVDVDAELAALDRGGGHGRRDGHSSKKYRSGEAGALSKRFKRNGKEWDAKNGKWRRVSVFESSAHCAISLRFLRRLLTEHVVPLAARLGVPLSQVCGRVGALGWRRAGRGPHHLARRATQHAAALMWDPLRIASSRAGRLVTAQQTP